uniref:Protein kinase domain-containing protein n=1 Tax=Ananas comosus var. bracteatus TaxID=296719 RepID=A0A6V7QKI6_ANACO|nr:unnamed protein product [Ananas comosus var. bracteatus]
MEPKKNCVTAGGIAVLIWGPLLIQLLTLQLASASAPTIAKPGCQPRCGKVEIPYPFGIGSNCSMGFNFTLSCNFSDGTYKPFLVDIEFLNISLSLGQARITNYVSSQCYNVTDNDIWSLDFTASPYSSTRNKFTTVGCDTLAYILMNNMTNSYETGCVSMCADKESLTDGSCSGIGCCQTAIPKGINYYNVSFDDNFNSSRTFQFSPCSYAVLAEEGAFEFSTSYATTRALYDRKVPLVLDWAVTNKTCQEASETRPPTPARATTASAWTPSTALAIYATAKRAIKAILIYHMAAKYGGRLLLEEIGKKQGLAFTIFTKEELEEATNNFDMSNILGHGGNGTVYKGVLKDDRVVAIKRAKIINEKQKEEFGKEMIILAQINHKNVVKLLGCCFGSGSPYVGVRIRSEGELVPVTAWKEPESPVTFETRLRIATESAEALAYLHSSASPPIIHGDVKSPNILLDDHHMAKVADFGASRQAPMNEVQYVTLVQGTLGNKETILDRELGGEATAANVAMDGTGGEGTAGYEDGGRESALERGQQLRSKQWKRKSDGGSVIPE